MVFCRLSHIPILLSFAWLTAGQMATYSTTDPLLEQYRSELQVAAIEVLSQIEDRPPLFDMQSDFMHSFRPNTGVGNREDLVIEQISQVSIYDDSSFARWRYERFNNSDFLLGIGETNVVLWRKKIDPSSPMDLSVEDNIFQHIADLNSKIIDAVMFVRSHSFSDLLYAAILLENRQRSFVSIYEILGNKGLMVNVNDLGITSLKLAYLQSKHGSSLAALTPTEGQSNIIYHRKGSSNLNHYVEVRYPSPIDFVSFTVAGHGYLAVANVSTCEVYKVDEFVQNHLLFERIQFQTPIVDLERFRLGFHQYLAVSSENYQALYVWRKGEFKLTQEFFSFGVRQIYAALLPNCRDDVILFFIKDHGPPDLFVWHGQQEKFVPVEIEVPNQLQPRPETISSFSYGSKAYLLFVDYYGETQVFVVDTSLQAVLDPLLLVGKEISDLMQQLQQQFEEQEERIRVMSSALVNAVRPSGNQIFSTLQVFNDISSTKNVTGNVQVNSNKIAWDGSPITLDDYLAGTENLESRVKELEDKIHELEVSLLDAVLVDEDAVITGSKIFLGDVYGSSVVARSLNINSAGDIDIRSLQKEIYRLDKPETIAGTITFTKPLKITGDLDVGGTINGIDLSEDVMTTNTHQISHSEMFVNKLIVRGDLNLTGKLNNLNVNSDIVTLYGNHVITGKKKFLGGIVSGAVQTEVLNNVLVDNYFSQAMTKSGDQTITGTKHFDGTLHTNDIVLRGTLNSYNLTNLADDIVRTDQPAVIVGAKTFLEDVFMKSTLTVDGKVNGLTMPDDLFLLNRENVVTGTKNFLGDVTVNDMSVQGTVDGLRLPEDIITLSADETIDQTVVFENGITVNEDIVVGGLVDGVDISELAKKTLKLNESTTIENAVFLGPVTIAGDLDVRGAINGVMLNELIDDIVFKDDTNVVIEAEKHFTELTAESVELKNMINGYNINVDFMTVAGDQEIRGKKTFKSTVVFQDVTTSDGLIDGVNIAQLYEDRVSLSVDEELAGDLHFVDTLVINGDLTVHGTLGGMKFPEDFVLKSKDQAISNKIFSGDVTIGNLVVENDAFVSGSFAGLDLARFIEERVTLSGEQVINGDLSLVNCSANEIEISGLVNGLDIVEFANNVMSLTKDQVITGHKQFSGTTKIYGSVTTKKGINGVNLTDLNRRAFKLHDDQVITYPLTFHDDVRFQNLRVDGLINGINITELDRDSVKKEGLQYISGKTTFQQGFHVEGDIVTPSVNGMKLPEDILTKSTPQTITGSYTFKNVVVSGDVDVGGFVNGLDLSEVSPLLARTDRPNVIRSNLVFQSPVHVSNDIEVSGLVNGIDLLELERTALARSGQQAVSGHKILRGNVTVYGDVDVTYVNNVKWKEFIDDVVRIDVPQTIYAPKIFSSEIEVNGDVEVTGTAEVGLLNGVNLTQFLEDAVFIDQPAFITGRKIFTNSIAISNDLNADFINRLNLTKDVIILQCTNNVTQIITGLKTFANLTVLGDISVQGYVNGQKLPNIVANTLTMDGDQTITGTKTFLKQVRFLKDVYPSTVNSLYLYEDLVTLHTDQAISGPLVFKNDVHVNQNLDISGLLNGVDLKKLAAEALYVDTEQEIEGVYTIQHAVANSDVIVEGTVNGIDLNMFSQNVTNFWSRTQADVDRLMRMSQGHCEVVENLYTRLQKSYFVLDGFNLHQTLDTPADYVQLDQSGRGFSLIQLHDGDQSVTTSQYQWQPMDRRFVFSSVGNADVRKQKFFRLINHELVMSFGSNLKESAVWLDGTRLSAVSRGFSDADAVAVDGKVVVVLLYPKRSICEMYEIEVGEKIVKSFGNLAIEGATAVTLFDISRVLYLAVSSDFSPKFSKDYSKLYARNNRDWQLVQNIPAPASSFVKHFAFHGYHYLAFTNAVPVYETKEPKTVQIYRNAVYGNEPFSLFQKLPFDNANSLEVFEFGGLSELYLTVYNKTRIQVFLLEGETGFRSNFTLRGRCISSVKPLLLDNELFLAVAENHLESPIKSTSVVYRGLTQGFTVSKRTLKHCSL